MTTSTNDEILARILYKLLNNRCYRKGHMLEEHIISAFPKHKRGDARKVLRHGVRRGLIVIYGKTKYGLAYQLDIKKLDEIEKIVKKQYGVK